MIPTGESTLGGSTDTTSDDGVDYDAGDLTGVSGDMGDDPLNDRNTVEGDNDTTAPADSTTGLTNDGTTVTDRNEPADVTEDAEESLDDQDGLGVDYTGLPSDPEEDVADAVEDASEDSPVTDDVTDDEWQDIQDDNNAASDVVDDVQNAVDNATDGPILPEMPGVPEPAEMPDVPWKFVGAGAVLLGLVVFGPGASTAAAGAGVAGSTIGD